MNQSLPRRHRLSLPLGWSLTVARNGKRRFDAGRFFSVLSNYLQSAHATIDQCGDTLHFQGAGVPSWGARPARFIYAGVVSIDEPSDDLIHITYRLFFGPQLALIGIAVVLLGVTTILSSRPSGIVALLTAGAILFMLYLGIGGVVFWRFRRRLRAIAAVMVE